MDPEAAPSVERRPTAAERNLEEAVKTAVRDAKKHVGQTMRNGGMILMNEEIEEDAVPHARVYKVLAATGGGYQPFVVWTRIIGAEQKSSGAFGSLDYCYAGDHFRDLEEAIAAFHMREH